MDKCFWQSDGQVCFDAAADKADPRIVAREGRDVVVTTYENRANLAPGFFEQAIRKYDGTRLGRQELLAEVLEDTPGALWNRDALDQCRTRLSSRQPCSTSILRN